MIRSPRRCGVAWSLPTRLAVLIAGLALWFAQPAHALTAEELQKQLAERDARIAELVRRIERLEAAARPASDPAAAAPAVSVKPGAGEAGRTAPQQAQASPPPSGSPGTPPPEAPAAVAVEESARALERALVREGGLVLPRGAWELEPEILYRHRSSRGLRLVDQGGQTLVADADERQDSFEPSLAIRTGLPGAMQAELRVPYVFERRNTAFTGISEQTEDTSGFGDVEVSLTKQLLNERPAVPGLLGTVSYRTTTGRSGSIGSLSPGAGYRSLQLTSTAVKRLDPMVFIGSLSYAWQGSRDDGPQRLDPGNVLGLKLGTVLAASPETSLRFGLDVSRSRQARLNGLALPGSEATVGLFELGVSTLLSPRTLLSVQTGIGLTQDAPDFQLRISLPFRF